VSTVGLRLLQFDTLTAIAAMTIARMMNLVI
jgi:hypothetical protein